MVGTCLDSHFKFLKYQQCDFSTALYGSKHSIYCKLTKFTRSLVVDDSSCHECNEELWKLEED